MPRYKTKSPNTAPGMEEFKILKLIWFTKLKILKNIPLNYKSLFNSSSFIL